MPFFLITKTGEPHINKTRIIESVIYAVVGGLLSSYVTIKVMEYQIADLSKKVDKIYNDIYKPYMGDRISK
jgi:hypothetical protein